MQLIGLHILDFHSLPISGRVDRPGWFLLEDIFTGILLTFASYHLLPIAAHGHGDDQRQYRGKARSLMPPPIFCIFDID